jgi:hypothetical protein
MKRRWILAASFAGIGVWALFLGECSGPRPAIASVVARAPARAGDPWSVEAAVKNRSWGEGDVSVTLRLRDASGKVYEDEERVHLEGRRTIHVAGRIAAPPGDYRPDARAEYPPQ